MSDEKKERGRSWPRRVLQGVLRVLRSFPPATARPSAVSPAATPRSEDVPRILAILPLRNAVLFPCGELPLAIGRRKNGALIRDAVRDSQVIGVVTQRRAEAEDPGLADLYPVGTVARVVKRIQDGERSHSLVVQGVARFRVLELAQEVPYLKARVELVEDRFPPRGAADSKVLGLGLQLREAAREVFELMPQLPPAAMDLLRVVEDPGHLANMIAANVCAPQEEVQAVLEVVDVGARMERVLGLLGRKRELLQPSTGADPGARGERSKILRLVPSPADPSRDHEESG